MAYLLFGLLLLEGVYSTTISERAFTPTVRNANVVGMVAEPALNRDSCGSSRVGDRALWTCRDSQPYGSNGAPILPLWSSSASWSNLNSDGGPCLRQYGGGGSQRPYFPYGADECGDNSAGSCNDGTRYALWPDSPPLLASTADGIATAYTWIRKEHINPEVCMHINRFWIEIYLFFALPSAMHYLFTMAYLSTLDSDPATSLYKLTYNLGTADRNVLPKVTLLDEGFWPDDSIPYGAYGNVLKDGIAYLFGQSSKGMVALAKVPSGAIEDRTQYQYWVNGSWTTKRPSINDTNANIPNVNAGGQGTYYFSTYWNKWVWIGQAGISVSADFFITTADSITGPWASAVKFYSGVTGTFYLGAYTLQAHPGLNPAGRSTNEIYISYTKADDLNGTTLYSTPLIHIQWN
ncbi:hypothetical protein GGR50DRAFT_702881 [Xylaria sp. CBS 124048]|nr:hypothetical protein GGR50DRAFT_702881 [Xylaria sp. CBS 124048]